MTVCCAWQGASQVRSLLAPDAIRRDVLVSVDAIVSVTTGGSLDSIREAILLGAIARPENDVGRPVDFLGLHGASCSFANSPAYLEMLGGRFRGHPPMKDFEVRVEDRVHPMTRNVQDFVIHDELYLLQPIRRR